MKLWVARNDCRTLEMHRRKPSISKITGRPVWINGDFIGFIFDDLFPEVTFENSPKEVEIVLPKTYNKVWHDIDEEPIYVDGVTPLIINSNYGHISQEGHYYDQVQWKYHIESQRHREFKWAYEKDLINL